MVRRSSSLCVGLPIEDCMLSTTYQWTKQMLNLSFYGKSKIILSK